MDTRDTPPAPSVARPPAGVNAYEAFWLCLEDGAPATAANTGGGAGDAYRQFWDLTEGD
jgi:hypothetical protein